MRCASCGRELEESIKFCDGCGTPVAKPAPAMPAPKPPSQAKPQPPPGPPPAAPKKKGKCGCLAGVAVVVLLVLLLACSIGGFNYWKHGGRDRINRLLHRGEEGGTLGLALPARPRLDGIPAILT